MIKKPMTKMGAILFVALFGVAFLDGSEPEKLALLEPESIEVRQEGSNQPKAILGEIDEALPDKVIFEVPFTSQAPIGNWDDPRYQNACEEASIIMAMHWVIGDSDLSAGEANQTIADLVEFEKNQYGFFIDASAADTARFARDYYEYDNIEARKVDSVEEIKRELAHGNLVVVPADGRKLGNPFFTAPGPERHMLVIIGYNEADSSFITNDPGTRRGRDYAYKQNVLFEAIRDYPSGDHAPIIGIQKSMIVISK